MAYVIVPPQILTTWVHVCEGETGGGRLPCGCLFAYNLADVRRRNPNGEDHHEAKCPACGHYNPIDPDPSKRPRQDDLATFTNRTLAGK